MSAARIWWMFRAFGHDNVAVLDGGLPKWRKEGRPVESGDAKPARAQFQARFRPELVRDVAGVTAALQSGSAQVVDARSRGRFNGTEPEIRPGLRGGHMPGAKSLPFTDLLGPDATLLPAARLRALFQEAGVDVAKPVVTSCGSGVTACVLALGLHQIGRSDVAIYDGSWTEWGGRTDTAVTTG
jgi:thiosulfate/3-mercaptopyruvate sulfurtransferase